MTKLQYGFNTSREGWRCYLGAFRNAVRFEIGGAVAPHGDRKRRTYHMTRV